MTSTEGKYLRLDGGRHFFTVRIKSWFAGLRFKSKVIALFLPLLVASLLALGILSSQLFSRSIIERTEATRPTSRL